MLVAYRPSSIARSWWLRRPRRGARRRGLGLDLERDQLVGERAGPALEGEVLSVRPYMGPSASSRLTDCSVYASLGGVTSASAAHCRRRRRRRRHDRRLVRVVPARGRARRRRARRGGTLGTGASSRAAGMVRAQGGTETAVRLGMFSRDFYAGQRTGSASTPASSRRATSCRASPSARSPTRTARIAMQQGARPRRALGGPRRVRRR